MPSPLKKRLSGAGSNLIQQQEQPQRYGTSVPHQSDYSSAIVSPDVYNNYTGARGGCGRDSKSTILSEEFDDILTITTDTERNESDIVIVDYHDVNDRQAAADYNNLLKPPSQPPAKTSLINRFLRNVTQKKILETSIRRNNFFAHKLKTEQKLFTGNLYVKGAKPRNLELIEDLNAEIAMEIEMSGVNSPRKELTSLDADLPGDLSRFELGIGEISIDVFADVHLHILRDESEQLMKVFKLYTGYSKEGYMTPVLVLLTDQTLYVADLVRNRLCSKFVLAYKDLDVILVSCIFMVRMYLGSDYLNFCFHFFQSWAHTATLCYSRTTTGICSRYCWLVALIRPLDLWPTWSFVQGAVVPYYRLLAN